MEFQLGLYLKERLIMHKTLFCDMDGVLADFNKAYSKIFNQLIGGPIITKKEEALSWDWGTWYPGATPKVIKEAWKILRETKDFWQSLDILDRQGLSDLRLLTYFNYDIYFVTSRLDTIGKSAMRQTQEWLEEWGFHGPNVIVTWQKNALAALMRANVIIDDKPEFFMPSNLDLNLEWEHIALIDYPHNRDMFMAPNVIRYNSLHDALEPLLKQSAG